MANFPIVYGSYNTWGTELLTWLSATHENEGGHDSITSLSKILIDGTVTNGDVVYYDSTSTSLKLAVADGTEKQKAIAMIESFDSTSVVFFGKCDSSATLIPNSTYYLSPSVPGGITVTRPTTNIVEVGAAFDATYLFVNINHKNDDIVVTTTAPTRTFGVSYQPDTSNNTFVTISNQCDTSASGVATYAVLSDSSNPPVTIIANAGIPTGIASESNIFSTSFIVRRGDYYKVDKTETAGTVTNTYWIETSLVG